MLMYDIENVPFIGQNYKTHPSPASPVTQNPSAQTDRMLRDLAGFDVQIVDSKIIQRLSFGFGYSSTS